MSFPAEERESVNAPIPASRNPVTPAPEKDKPQDKPKPLPSQTGGLPSEGQHALRAPMDLSASMKIGKPPMPNRPIAPAAAASNLMAMGGHIGAGYMPGFGAALQGHPMVNPALSLPASMLHGPMAAHHPFPTHVPVGAAAAARAGAPPRSISSMRSAPKPGITAHHQGPVSTQQPGHPSVSVAPSALAASAPPATTVTAMMTYYQQSSEHKQSDMRDGRPPLVADLVRRVGSPQCPSPTQPTSGSVHPLPTSTAKIGLPGILTTAPKPAQAVMVPHFSQTHSPMHVTAATVAPTLQPAISRNSPGVQTGLHQAKMGAVSVAPVGSKMFSPHMNFAVSKPPQHPDGSGSGDVSRMASKPTDKASLVVQHTTSNTAITSAHVIAATPTMHSSIVADPRMERTHQSVSLPNPMYHPSITGPYLFGEQFHGYPIHIPYGHSSALRSSHTSTTAAPTATVMNPTLIMDHGRYIALPQHAGPFGGLTSNSMVSEAPGSSGMVDGSGNPGIYGMSMLGMQQGNSNLQVPITAGNPNATSPRPSILRKRTFEGLRKPTVVPYNDGTMSSTQVERPASPRSDTTLSAPQSGQSSPKPPSEAGSQVNEQNTPSISVAPAAAPNQESAKAPVADPVTKPIVKEEPADFPAPAAAVPAAAVAAASSSAVTPASSSTTEKPPAPLPDGASPRKKPRKQNVVVTQDKYGSSVPIEQASEGDDEKKAKQQSAEEAAALDDDLKFILLKRPKISIFGGYKVNTKAAHNHFLKYTDVKLKEERKPTIQDLANQKGILNRVNGWRVQHIAAQMDELNSAEQEVLAKLFELRDKLPKPRQGQRSKYQDELLMLDELIQGNIQRSQLVSEQLCDSRKSMVKVLEHRPRCLEILQKYTNKRNPKKKS